MNTETTSTAGVGIKKLNDRDLIFCEIRKGKDYFTQVSGATIVEVLEKIKDYHTMGNVAKQHYTKKGRLEKELSTGWYFQEESSMNTLNDYQVKAWSYALPTAKDSTYLFLGLAGEVGELCSAQAKWIRDNPTTTDEELWEKKQEMLKKELGDILWFVAGLASNYYWKLEDIAQMNINKLEDRKQRNVIKGSGDER